MTARGGRWLRVLAPLMAFGLASCGEGGSLLIEMTSDFEAPGDLDELQLQVVGDESGGMLDETFTLTEPFPQSYRVHPREDHQDEAVTVTVTGRSSGTFVVRRVVRGAFSAGSHETLRVHLGALCAGVECPEGVDCIDGRCEGIVSDGGLDGGMPMDGAMDAGDLGCTGDGECDDAIACTVDTCQMGECFNNPDDSLCGSGEVCHVIDGCGEPCGGDGDCDDGVFCDGQEICFEGRCMEGTAQACDDGFPCTEDSCDEAAESCMHAPDDSVCDDGDACNGMEICDLASGCAAGAPLDCDDGNDCTSDVCTASACAYATRDADGDGHGDAVCPEVGGVPADDCDDTEPAIRPGSPEICNGVDDDCNGSVDETFTCASGSVGDCTTSCGSTGSRTCSGACGWSVCSPPVETCNGEDDDCNGAADDGFACVQGASVPCTTSCGTSGTQRCDATCALEACQPPEEICEDGIDQDCDGVDPLCTTCPGGTDAECDDGLPCNGVETCFRGLCASGTPLTCDDGVRCTVDGCDNGAGGCVYLPDDRFCDDGSFCNGDEVCDPTSGCGPGSAPTCDDADSCTDDACVGSMPGMCVLTTRDADGDGHGTTSCAAIGGVPADDCDDTDSGVYLGAPELCNGGDDDCDGACDDGFACCRGETGSCTTTCGTTGNRVCSSVCSWGVCSPPAETCNGVDDDCNGACDDGFACCQGEVGMCLTSCGSFGSRSCSGSCGWDACVEPTETCSGVDDDCDTLVDEGFTCQAGAMGSCTTSCGSTGVASCNTSCEWDSCVPPTEECNGADDDCDGLVDEDFTCTTGSTRSCLSGCGTTGTQSCTASCNWGSCTPPSETCSGADEDCDTFIDEGFTCRSGATGSCTTSCGTTGSRTCDATCAWGSCSPPTEVCNAADDDCDGICDDGFSCCRGTSETCTTSCGSTGSRLCGASCAWGSCTPPVESCSGSDDDCDGATDEGFTCVAGSSGGCTTSCGSAGSRTCSAACGWGSCNPPTETCNGTDDDCDGTVDEGFTCAVGSMGSCSTSCGTTGSRTCSAACGWGACNPPPEACNGTDDDCDTNIDEALECVAGSNGSCTTTCGSTGSRVCGASCTWNGCMPPAETCNGADDDCDATVDEGFACPQGTTGSCATSCGSTGTRTCSASCGWGSCTAPTETCNGADDDCDTLVDEGFTCAAGSSGSCSTSCGSTGTRTCTAACGWGMCSPPAETCDGADDDCDTLVDEGFTCAAGSTSSCLSSCGTTGSRTCSGTCGWGSCNAPAETCNGTDDDCDGLSDETFACAAGTDGACTTTCGSTGSRRCSAICGWGSCDPPMESCNGGDDDCDGLSDEDFLCAVGATSGCLTSCGSTGARTCNGSCGWGSCLPPTESCDGADDDCDGFVDEGFTCAVGAAQSCTTSCGSTGSQTCGASCGWGSCAPPTEVCNGADDDCDGTVDEGFTCAPGASQSCATGCGSTGSQTCSASCSWGACTPPAETCNANDDDCDVAVDEAFACPAGSSGACTTSCGSTGSRMCSAACAWGSCNPPSESCNGVDDDCDGVCDDGFTCCQGAVGTCTTGCGTTGTRSCSASCSWGSCDPPAETCNGIDDDCDGTCDNGFTCCSGDGRSCTTSCGSTGSQTCDGTCGWGACTAPAEVCNGADDDCDGTCDDGFTCCSGASRSCTTSCGSTGTETCNGACSGWGSCAAPAETCDNGGDDDCDGDADCADADCATFPSCASCAACSGATTVTAPGGSYTVSLGADTHTGSCGGAGSEAYLSLSLTSTADVFITTHGAGIDTVLYVRSCNCSGSEIGGGCNDDDAGYTTSALTLPSLPPGDYQIFVDTKVPMSANLDVHVYATAPGMASDRCGQPTAIPAGTTNVMGNTCGYSADYEPLNTGDCTSTTAGDAVEHVYYFVVPATGDVTFDAGCLDGSYDQTIFMRSNCIDGTTSAQVACNDDAGCSGSPSCGSARYTSAVTATLAPGVYFFFADGWQGTTGSCACGDYNYAVSGL